MKLTNKIPVDTRSSFFAITCICLITLALVFPASSIWAEDRPTIQVNFDFEGQLFDRIPAEDRAIIKARAEEKVCEIAEESWGFLDWSNVQPRMANTAVWNVKLKVEIKRITNDAGNQISATIATLSHSGQLAAETFQFRQATEYEAIYPIGRMIPFTDPIALAEDVSSQLDKQLDTLLLDDKVKIFLQHIPIVERVIADAEMTRIVVPLKTSDLRTDVDSILRVKFKISDNWGDWLDLETANEVSEEGQYTGYVVGELIKERLSGVDISTPTPWDDQLSAVFDSASEIKVYMEEYNASLVPNVDGIVTDPEM